MRDVFTNNLNTTGARPAPAAGDLHGEKVAAVVVMAYNPFERGSFPVGVRTLTMRDDVRRGRELIVDLDAHLKDSAKARAFLDSHLVATFKRRGIDFESPAPHLK